MLPAQARLTSLSRNKRPRWADWPPPSFPFTCTAYLVSEWADVTSLCQQEGRSGMVEYQFPVHDGVSRAHQCGPLCVADRGRALRGGVPLCARSESDGKHLRKSVRTPL